MVKEPQDDLEAMLNTVRRLEADIKARKLKGLAYVEIYDHLRMIPGAVGTAASYPEIALGAAARLLYQANRWLDEDEARARKAQDQ